MNNRSAAFAALILMSSSALAQAPVAPPAPAAPTAVPIPAVAASPAESVATLAANSEVVLTLNEAVSSENLVLGDRVSLTVAQDVKVNGSVVIPHGTRAVSQITMRKGKGSFGKSGKLEIVFRYLDLDGRHIPIEGRYLQQGEGNGAATVGAVLAAGVIGGLVVHGHSARIPQGHEFSVRTVDAIPVTLASAGAPALIAASYTPSAVNMEVMTEKQRKAAEKAAGRAAEDARRAAGKH
jgi:hypothetical protein